MEEEIVITKVRVVKLENLGKAAERLGVSKAHLSRVLNGERISASLTARMKNANIRFRK